MIIHVHWSLSICHNSLVDMIYDLSYCRFVMPTIRHQLDIKKKLKKRALYHDRFFFFFSFKYQLIFTWMPSLLLILFVLLRQFLMLIQNIRKFMNESCSSSLMMLWRLHFYACGNHFSYFLFNNLKSIEWKYTLSIYIHFCIDNCSCYRSIGEIHG